MEDKIKKIIEKEFDAETLAITRITEGYSHYMYDVKINKEPFELIIRFSNNIQKHCNIKKEKYIIEILRENQLPAPKILAFHFPERKEDGYMIIEKFKGKRLDLIWDSLDQEEKNKITEKMGKMLSKMHSIKFKEFGYVEEEGTIDADRAFNFRNTGEKLEHSPFLRELLREFGKFSARLASYKTTDPKFLSKLTLYIYSNLETLEFKGEPTLNHGDFMTGHLFVEEINQELEITGMIDFEFAQASSPEYDFIKLHRQGFLDNPELKNALEKGYGKINHKAVEIHRLMRDFGFAWAVLESGNKKLSEKTLKEIEDRINKELENSPHLPLL